MTRVLPVAPGERLCVAVLFTHYFLVSAAVIAGKSARDAFFLSRYDKSILPLMYLANAVCVAVAVAAFSSVLKRFRPASAAAATLGFFSISLAAIELHLDGWMIGVLYVWMEVIGTIVILQAWLLTGDAFNPQQAKRLFGVVAAGGSIAAWAGGVGVAWVASRFGSSFLITLVAIALALSIGTASYSSRFRARCPSIHAARPAAAAGRRKLSAYVTSIAALTVSAAIVSAIVQYRFQVAAVAAYPSRDHLVAFFGWFYAWSGAASLAAQLFLSGFLLSRFRVTAGLFVLPASFVAGSLFTLVSPSLWSASVGRFSDLSLKFTVNNSCIELLWLPVPPAERQSVKPFVSGTLKAVAEALTALLLFLLVKFMPPWVLSVFALAVCAAWIATVLRLRRQYRAALAEVVEKRQLDADALCLSAADPAVVESIDRALRSSDEADQTAALAFLDGLPLRPWSAALQNLLAHGSSEIRERVFELAANDRTTLGDDVVLATARAGGALGSTAMEAAVSRGLEGINVILEDLASSEEPDTAIPAAAVMLRHNMAGSDAARRVLTHWLDSADPAAIARVLRLAPCDTLIASAPRLASLLRHSRATVRCAAIDAIAARHDSALLPELVAALGDPRCFRSLRLAIREMPVEAAVGNLVATLNQTTDERLRRAILRLLREYPDAVSEQAVTEAADLTNLSTYSEVADVLRAIRDVHPLRSDVQARTALDCAAIRTEAYLCDGMHARLNGDPDAILLRDYNSSRYNAAVETTLRLTALRYPTLPVDACLHAVASEDRALTPYVIELIEATLDGDDRRLLAPLVDASQAERRLSILRELIASPEREIEDRIVKATLSRDPWEAAVGSHYLARKGKLAVAAAADARAVGLQEATMYSTLEKTILLKSSEVFGGLSGESLANLAAIATEIRLPSEFVLFREGASGDCLYLVSSGTVRVVKGGAEITTLSKGACFGEMALLDGAPRSADAIIADEAVLLRIGSDEFYDILTENPALAQGIIRLLSRRLREANARIAQAEC